MVSYNPAPRSYTRTLACAKRRWLLSNLRLSLGILSWRFRTAQRLKGCVRIRGTPRSSKRSPKKVSASRPVTNRGEDNGYPIKVDIPSRNITLIRRSTISMVAWIQSMAASANQSEGTGMTPERWEKIRELFHATFERSADDRAVYLAHACPADSSLRADVEKLISSHEAAPSFLERTETTLPAVEGLPLLQPEQRVGHYRILGPIGHGGMGVVYKAEDTKLGRFVALKFLPAAWAKEPQALERFRREARAASALSHPNVCTIYAIDEDAGRPFIAMELLNGQTLAACIAGRPLATARLIELSVQIADGLQAAHEQGITHRDIKPENIFVTDKGQAKILDFGLARMMTTPENTSEGHPAAISSLADGTRPSLTQAGGVMGTVPYLSPEQLRGEQPDQRSDLFSFGTVMYEMATGKQAFSGSQETAVDAIVNLQPRSPLLSNPYLPVKLGRIIARALEKNRELRYQSAADLKADLLQIGKSTEVTKRAGRRWSVAAAVAMAFAAVV